MISINSYLDDILGDFQEYLEDGHRLCELKSVHFDQGKLPDYDNIHVQQYYLLRYAYGYSFEYKGMYQILLDKHPYLKKIMVTSIGCGTMLDYWALARALKQADMSDTLIKYVGIDQIDWNYQITSRSKDTVTFRKNDAVDELQELGELKSDVYFFPKSISEFSDDDFERLCDVFEDTPIKKDKIHILVSVRSNSGSMQRDLRRVRALSSAISKNGFETEDSCDRFWYAKNPEEKICKADSDFRHPSGVVDCLSEQLHTACSRYQKNRAYCEKDCKDRLSWWPILKQNQVCFIILTFERKEP